MAQVLGWLLKWPDDDDYLVSEDESAEDGIEWSGSQRKAKRFPTREAARIARDTWTEKDARPRIVRLVKRAASEAPL